uniref:Uncharacterized protein n=1 Tax=Ignisphaera aggregans TaxID=334771 RepID=A0A7J2U475_9CREN
MTEICEKIRHRTEIARLLALHLYEYFSLEFVVAVVRELFLQIGEPIAEGWIYQSFPTSMRYVMIYPCIDNDKNKYIEVVIDEDRDRALITDLHVYCITRDEIPIQEEGDEMTPVRISLEVVEKQDENNRMKEIIKLVES